MRVPGPLNSKFAFAIVSAMTLAGCDPVVNIAGANFPSWLFCGICGAILTIAIRPIFVATRIEAHLWPLPIVYLSLAILIGCVVWLVLFNRI